MLYLNDASKRFCDITNLTWAFCDSVLKTNLRKKLEPPVMSSKNDVIFQNYGHDVTMTT